MHTRSHVSQLAKPITRLLPGVPYLSIDAAVKQLFTNGEKGAWYDPSDMSTLFQDAAGTTPVTAMEQPVGLILDKSKGLVLGETIVQNGTFETDITGWNAESANVTISWDSGSGGRLKAVNSATITSTAVYQTIDTTPGKWYYYTLSVTGGTYRVVALAGTGFAGAALAVSDNVNGLYFLATASTTTIYFRPLVNSSTLYADNISVRELPGNHAYQSGATTLRPTVSARYNLLTYTEEFDNAAWSNNGGYGNIASVSPNTTLAPDGTTTGDTITFSVGGTQSRRLHSFSGVSGTTYTASVWIKQGTKDTVTFGGTVSGFSFSATYTFSTQAIVAGGGATVTKTAPDSNGWVRISFTGTASVTTTHYVGFVEGSVDGTVIAWGASLVPADQASLPYQRVAAATDYDTSPVFKPYIYFDGTDDSWVTNSIDFTGTDKMTVFAGVRKLSDAAAAVPIELSANVSTNNGGFIVAAPTAPTASYTFGSKGTVRADADSASVYPSPITNVLTGQGNISGDSAILRVNGAQAASSTADQGTGNYGNYPLYIGRRGGTTLPFKGNLYSLIVRGAASTEAQVQAAETYVNTKTGAY